MEASDEGKLRLYTERVVANARMALATGGLLAVYLDPAEPAEHAAVVYGALMVYLTASVVAAATLGWAAGLSPRIARRLHAFDIAFAGLLTSFTLGPGSPFFVFFWFVILAAAFRSGLRGAFQSALVLFAVLVGQALLLAAAGRALPLTFVVARGTYLGVMTFLLGYMAQKARDLRTEAVAVARVLGRTRQESTLSGGLRATLEELHALFDASRAVLLLTGRDVGRQCWVVERGHGKPVGRVSGITDADQEKYFFPLPPHVSTWWSSRSAASDETLAVDRAGNRARLALEPPAPFWDALRADWLLAADTTLGEDWHMRVYLANPRVRMPAALMVHVLHTAITQAAPAVQNLYLLRTQARSDERAQLGRELHDRVVQSLIGLEMQLAVLERHARTGEQVADRVRDIHRTVSTEIDNVRDLMQNLRPVILNCEELPMFLSDLVERFQRETGIRTAFAFHAGALDLTPRQCGELARIVQEALVNARRHSGATEVGVRLGHVGGSVVLSVEDNGRGFGFAGRLDDGQLRAQHQGPRVIKERARVMGASLSIESNPGRGSRLELVVTNGS